MDDNPDEKTRASQFLCANGTPVSDVYGRDAPVSVPISSLQPVSFSWQQRVSRRRQLGTNFVEAGFARGNWGAPALLARRRCRHPRRFQRPTTMASSQGSLLPSTLVKCPIHAEDLSGADARADAHCVAAEPHVIGPYLEVSCKRHRECMICQPQFRARNLMACSAVPKGLTVPQLALLRL